LLLAVLALAGGPPGAWAQTASQQREAAVPEGAGRPDGRSQAALRAMLSVGRRRRPGRDGSRDAAAAGPQGGRAVAVFEQAAKPDPPDYALLARTRAYRDLGRYDDAARLARDGARRFPGDTVWPLLLSLVLSDAGHTPKRWRCCARPPRRARRRSSG
jgi:hypothetical protein